jgi:hypothetical protein
MSARSISDSRGPGTLGSLSGGGVSERPKERASKAREGQPSAGSNPAATASLTRPNAGPTASLAPAFLAMVSNVVSIGPDWCVFVGPQEAVEAAGQVTVDRRNYVRVAAHHRGG